MNDAVAKFGVQMVLLLMPLPDGSMIEYDLDDGL